MADLEITATLNRLTDAVEARLPGVLHDIVRASLWDTIEDFCARSTYWTEVIDLPFSTNSEITVPAPAGAKIYRILEIYELGAYDITQPTTITLFEGDSTGGRALVALCPLTLDDTPAFILSTWFEALYEGTLSRLYLEPDKPYTNEKAGAFYVDRYEKFVTQAGRQAGRFVTDTPTRSADIERLYMAIRQYLDIDAPQTVVRQAAWDTIENFYIDGLACREHVYWRMGPCVQTIDFDPFSATMRVAWILDYRGLYRGKVEHPSVLRDLAHPTSTQERCGEAWLALKPVNLDAVECGGCGDLWSSWYEYVLAGSLYRLLLPPNRPYSNPKLAEYYYKRFRKGVAMARDVSARGYSAGVPTGFPYYARGSQHHGGSGGTAFHRGWWI